jgi:hypothetical protein
LLFGVAARIAGEAGNEAGLHWLLGHMSCSSDGDLTAKATRKQRALPRNIGTQS